MAEDSTHNSDTVTILKRSASVPGGTSEECEDCQMLYLENIALKQKSDIRNNLMLGELRPAYPCDQWDGKSRTCWLNRNVGDTVTFVLAFRKKTNPEIQWSQQFHVFQSGKVKQYIIDPENSLWNIVIGSRGHEMRISPITEMDIDFNSFKATIVGPRSSVSRSLLGGLKSTTTVHFKIRVMALDQGFVYPGETLSLNMRRVNLPPSGMTFKWYLEKDGESGTLPSNMRLSPSGAVLTIAELRKEQEGVLACSVFTNMNVFATKRRFYIKELNESKLVKVG
ncbi:EGF-like domain-containing protein [Caerostris darwini]|uniref:EGF-like domain-containing protein n=1 Tax=Caerostris darwini TaxID=1538125 RepID=A0AAV4VGB2_9ARAC|nr:EGF-like domain-containing protein [Caerostris darwini]